MEYKIALIPGDGIGPEIVREARKVLDAVCSKYGHKFIYSEVLLGGASIDVHGVPLTEEAVETAKASDAVLMGSIGAFSYTHLEVYKRHVLQRSAKDSRRRCLHISVPHPQHLCCRLAEPPDCIRRN